MYSRILIAQTLATSRFSYSKHTLSFSFLLAPTRAELSDTRTTMMAPASCNQRAEQPLSDVTTAIPVRFSLSRQFPITGDITTALTYKKES